MSEPSTDPDDRTERRLKLAVVVVGAFVLLYGVVVTQQILAAIVLLVWLFVVYLVWRFVRAHERLADAATRVADAETADALSTRGEREETVTAGDPTDESVDSAEE
ncbi:hypothetical protein [Salinigranum marinum]|uniref:hypothetical protein n=1 Tax=Salinigranum marinum TaxID=1515595 RepID=UPI002989C608|nr:hypothetical protein [Salinigranum marinum]